MTAVSLFDVLARHGNPNVSGDPKRTAQMATLGVKLVESALADWERILEYERQVGSANFEAPALEEEIDRSLYGIYEKWAGEADQILSRTRQLADGGMPVAQEKSLEDAYCRVQARLKLTPDMLARAREQVRQGQVVPLKELRDEFHARVRA